jgi:hypothetical protein
MKAEGRRYLREDRGTDRAINARACESACKPVYRMSKFYSRELIRFTQQSGVRRA